MILTLIVLTFVVFIRGPLFIREEIVFKFI